MLHLTLLTNSKIKPNIGHSEAASSIGTIIKAVLALENGIIPPTTGVTKLNPQSEPKALPRQVAID